MKLEEAAKVAGIASTAATAAIAIAGYFANAKLSALDERLKALSVSRDSVRAGKERYDVSARLMTEYSVSLARAFAIRYRQNQQEGRRQHIAFATPQVGRELSGMLGGWADRKGLMTGQACAAEGLKARQLVLLVVRNLGVSDATDVRLRVAERAPPGADPRAAWREVGPDGRPLTYAELRPDSARWTVRELEVEPLRGSSSPEDVRLPAQIVLASVAGASDLFGTVVMPIELSWTDDVTRARHAIRVLPSNRAQLISDLVGAEIGSASTACR